MCILFLHSEDSPQPGKFKLILASNRDESYKRPALYANYWKEDISIFGGRDMEPGREGGTWLAMAKSGKIGILLNILMPTAIPNPCGRGFLVANFVKDPTSSDVEYLNCVKNDGKQYSHFNMIAIEIKHNGVKVSQYSNASNQNPETLPSGTLGFGNSALEKPFQKVIEGKKLFTAIINKYGSKEHKKILIEELMAVLKCKTSHYPDEKILEQVPNMPDNKHRMHSSIYAESLSYGTRTHTVILVDHENQVDFIEWTMEEPINSENVTWIKHQTSFRLDLQ